MALARIGWRLTSLNNSWRGKAAEGWWAVGSKQQAICSWHTVRWVIADCQLHLQEIELFLQKSACLPAQAGLHRQAKVKNLGKSPEMFYFETSNTLFEVVSAEEGMSFLMSAENS